MSIKDSMKKKLHKKISLHFVDHLEVGKKLRMCISIVLWLTLRRNLAIKQGT